MVIMEIIYFQLRKIGVQKSRGEGGENDRISRPVRDTGNARNGRCDQLFREGCDMIASETLDGLLGMKLSRRGQNTGADLKSLEYLMASGLGSRGGPNKVSNKLRSSPQSYVADSLDYLMASALRSRGGPNKVTNKLKRSMASYLYYN
jgi:hypothetical protein